MTTSVRKGVTVASAGMVTAVLLAGCGAFAVKPAPLPPPRLRIQGGQEYAAASAYLAAHPVNTPKGMIAGILASSPKQSPWCAINGCTWSGTAIVAGGYVEHLTSSSGDAGMASLVAPGDEFVFPAGGDVNTAAENNGDNSEDWAGAVRVVVAGAVALP